MTYTLHPRLLDPEPWLVQETDKMISEHQMRGEVDSIAPPSVFAESVQSLGATRAVEDCSIN